MSEPSLALQRGIYATLTAATEVTALVGSRVFDQVAPNPTFPYIRIGNDQVLASDTPDCLPDCVEVYAQVDVYSRQQGKTEAKAVAGAIVRALDEDSIVLESGYALQSFLHNDTRYLDDPDGLSTHAVLMFHALIDGT